MIYMGIDLHKRYLFSTVIDEDGKEVERARVGNKKSSILAYISEMKKIDEEISVVVEATSNCSKLYDELEDLVDDICIANPLKTKAIASARIKTDKIDSRTLALLLRSDLIPKAHMPDKATREMRELARYHVALTKVMTSLKNRVHAILDKYEIESQILLSASDIFGKLGVSELRSTELSPNHRKALNGYLNIILAIKSELSDLKKKIKMTAEADEVCSRLRSIPGIGDLLSVLIRYEIDEVDRFPSPAKLASYAGIIPSTYQSADKLRHGRITKQGNSLLRWALIEATQVAIVHSAYFRNYYERIKSRIGAKPAIVSTARRLLEIVYSVWKHKRDYYEVNRIKDLAVALT
ncbi:MAG: IS110 family transposase [Actinobacteria bacterium]|nr:IS110 family transposase [Actinomycetota bacterium]